METRKLFTIAREIMSDWPKPYFGAIPYINAMRALDDIEDNFFDDPGREIVAYFLGNAQTWRGETARRIKKELNAML